MNQSCQDQTHIDGIYGVIDRYTEALISAFRAKETAIGLNHAKVLSLFAKIERALIDSTKEIASYRIETYQKIIDGLNAQTREIEENQKKLIAAMIEFKKDPITSMREI